MAILVWDSPGQDKDTIELPVGDGGQLEKVELSGDDPGRKLVGVAIGPKALAAKTPIAKMSPRWRVPFEGFSFDIAASAGVVVGEPSDGVRTAWDATDGKLLWKHDEVEGELFFFGENGAGFTRPDGKGGFVFGAMDSRTKAVRWQKPLPAGERPLAGGQGGGDLGVITSGGFYLVRFDDGAARFSMPLEPGIELANIRSTTKSLLWVKQRDTERWLHFATLPPL
jgi:hypothetical protein